MQLINLFKLQLLPANVDTLNAQLQDALILAMQALCAADPRKVISRADVFPGNCFLPSQIFFIYADLS